MKSKTVDLTNLESKTIEELVLLKEKVRQVYDLHIENDMGERGSFNNKTKPYWCCAFKKRLQRKDKKGQKYNGHIAFQTFDSYREAVIFCLEQVEFVVKRFAE